MALRFEDKKSLVAEVNESCHDFACRLLQPNTVVLPSRR